MRHGDHDSQRASRDLLTGVRRSRERAATPEGGTMTARIKCVTVDSADPYRQSLFWAVVTGFGQDPENPNEPDDPEALLLAPDGAPALLFVPVPETKTVKNRLHLDLVPTDRTRDEEVARLVELGAELVADRRNPDGTGWVVLTDPEGNEFCVERSDAERAGSAAAATAG